MNRNSANIVILLFCMAITAILAWGISSYITRRHLYTEFSSIELSEIEGSPNTSDILDAAHISDNKDFDVKVLDKLTRVVIYQPDISKLRKDSLLVLCKLVVYRRHGGFNSLTQGGGNNFITDYLDSIASNVFEQVRKSKGNLQAARQALVASHTMTPSQLKAIQAREKTSAKENSCE